MATPAAPMSLVTTIRERCRVCYTCVRECPAKAIRIADGQAAVVPERCIGCGNCVRVCSQNAKYVMDAVADVQWMLQSDTPTRALVAPSFPAEFADVDYPAVVGMLRKMGFASVHEVAFGADLVAKRYRQLLDDEQDARFIATSCPAIVSYVERYHPQMVGRLAPIVSPMIATARMLRKRHEGAMNLVFIGPCIAKKSEAAEPNVSGEIDAVLTFSELRAMMIRRGLKPRDVEPYDFDGPHGGVGATFAISRGLLQTAKLQEDLMTGEVVTADGCLQFPAAIREFEAGNLDARLLEVLCCNGCIMGAGSTTNEPLFTRRSRVSQFARMRTTVVDQDQWQADMERYADLDLHRDYLANDQRVPMPSRDDLQRIMAGLGKTKPQDELNCGACGYHTCMDHAIAIHRGLAEEEMCLPHTIEKMRQTMGELTQTNRELASAREQLVQSEKLASMGQLAAGIAHEVNNPLGVVLMYAHLLLEETTDSKLREDLQMVVDQAGRCRKIVGGLLDFARQNKVVREPVEVRDVIDAGLRTVAKPDNIVISVKHGLAHPTAELDRDQMVQVLTNLLSNAYAAMPDGGLLTISTHEHDGRIDLAVSDTGTGISPEHLPRVFDPFFTTKPMGKGTGLGLAVTYGIVKMHRGDIRVNSNTDPAAGPTGTTFTVTLPRQGDTQ